MRIKEAFQLSVMLTSMPDTPSPPTPPPPPSLCKPTTATARTTWNSSVYYGNYTNIPAIVHPVQKLPNQSSPLVISLYK